MTLSGVRISWLVLARKAVQACRFQCGVARAGEFDIGRAALGDVAEHRHYPRPHTQIDHHRGEQGGHGPAVTRAQVGLKTVYRSALEELAPETPILR
jgi:hypothetical protein